MAFFVTKPTDAGRQTLEVNLFARLGDPPLEVLILGEELQDGLVSLGDVFWVTRKCSPAEGTVSFTEQGTDVGRNESGEF